MPTPAPGSTVRAWIWPADFFDLCRPDTRLKSAIVEKAKRGQFLIPIDITVVEDEVQAEADNELRLPPPPETKDDPPPPADTPLDKSRRRFHALFAEYLQNPWERDDTRHAILAAHPDLPADEKQFEVHHYRKLIQEIERHGPALMNKALQLAAETDPADPVDVEELEALLENANPESNRTRRARWAIERNVGAWVKDCLVYQRGLAAA